MKVIARSWIATLVVVVGTFAQPAAAVAQSHGQQEHSARGGGVIAEDATRYMALGDSIASGYKAVPVTDGYPYVLYEKEVFDEVTHTLFCNAAVPGATSSDVLLYQVTQAVISSDLGGFNPQYVTLTMGGNDLLKIMKFIQTNPTPAALRDFANGVLTHYGINLYTALLRLRGSLPNAQIFVANQYGIPEIEEMIPAAAELIGVFNGVVRDAVKAFPTNVHLVDIHTAFLGRHRLLLGERRGATPFETHLTSAGHRVMARAFADVIEQNR
jgi:lysophospholipase L1-like esterase